MKSFTHISIIILLINVFMACSDSNQKKTKTPKIQEIVVIDDGYNTNENGELILDDHDVRSKTINISKEKSEESTMTGADGSQIKVMHDGYGNKTITRFFYDHPLISGIVTRVSAVGVNKTFVYTKDGLVKQITENYANLFEAGSANEIAKKVGIFSLNKNESYKPLLIDAKEAENYDLPGQNSEPYENYSQNPATKIPIAVDRVEAQKVELIEEKLTPTIADNTFIEEFEAKIAKPKQITKKNK